MALAERASQVVVRRFAAGALVGCAVLAAFMALRPVTAQAWTTACPTAPADYAGTDPVVSELRSLRQENAASCEAVRERTEATARMVGSGPNGEFGGAGDWPSNSIAAELSQTNDRLDTLTARIGATSSPASGTTNELLAGVKGALSGTLAVTGPTGPVGVACVSGCAPTGPTGDQGAVVTAVDAGTTMTDQVRYAVWALLGAIVISLCVLPIVRRWWLT